jgi:transcriptional regulator with XRE-family HTH domain
MKGSYIKAERERLGWTQGELAMRARINRRTVVNIETGRHAPHPNTLKSIKRALEAAEGIARTDKPTGST